jgi:hypothetical protein
LIWYRDIQEKRSEKKQVVASVGKQD